ncbi:MAG: cysteine desulfurase-like protein [Chloroflexi bacterium]|nr:cysteine desulfurase-like protein [Chloroflexota bacterium]
MTLDIARIRACFPALTSPDVYLDNPGGTQVPHHVIDRMVDYLVTKNANHEGAFATSRASDALVDEARRAAADFFNATKPEEIVFGANMTTLTFHLSRSLAQGLQPGDEIIVTRLDHDANISPWLRVAKDRDCVLRWLDFDVEDGTLCLDQLDGLLSRRTKLLACGYASNALGTINPVAQIIARAHQAGALAYVDAVHYAPHGPIDVQALGCDFLVASAYKFFGPHLGVLYGRYDLLDGLPAYRIRPAPPEPPGKFETGTGNFEGIAGVLGALDYLAWVGETFGAEHAERYRSDLGGRRLLLKQAMSAIRAHEIEMGKILLDELRSVPGLRIYGLTEPRRLDQRVPTFSFTLAGHEPRTVAEALGREGIYTWDGNYYALAVTERLGLEATGGMVRVGLAHYNTRAEIERLGKALRAIAG